MKTTQNNKLAFLKSAVAELNASEMRSINGGSTIVGGETCSGCVCLPILSVVREMAVLM